MSIHNYTIILDSQIPRLHFPACTCIYKNINTYTVVEVNTGLYIGSMKPITKIYQSIDDLLIEFANTQSSYPFLEKYIIVNDMCGQNN